MTFSFKKFDGSVNKTFLLIQVVLLTLILIGVGLLLTLSWWVPKTVNFLLKYYPPIDYTPTVVVNSNSTSTADSLATTTELIPKAIPLPKPKPTPTPVPDEIILGGVEGVATIGPVCPVVRYPDDGSCDDKPYQTTLVLATTIIGRNGGVLVKTDENGKFSLPLGPGTYTLRAQSEAMLPRLEPITFEVKANATTSLALQFDSGIR